MKVTLETHSKAVSNPHTDWWIVLKPNASVPTIRLVQRDFPAQTGSAKTFAPPSFAVKTLPVLVDNANVFLDTLQLQMDANLKAAEMMEIVRHKKFALQQLTDFGNVWMDVHDSSAARMLCALRKITSPSVSARTAMLEIQVTSKAVVKRLERTVTLARRIVIVVRSKFALWISMVLSNVSILVSPSVVPCPMSIVCLKIESHSASVWTALYGILSPLLVNNHRFQIATATRIALDMKFASLTD